MHADTEFEVNLLDSERGPVFTVDNGRMETGTENGQQVLRWHINSGQTSHLSLRPELPLFQRLRYFDVCELSFRIVSGDINSMGLEALGHVSGPRQYKVHQFGLAIRTTPKNEWHYRQLDLARPNWFPWDNPDGIDRDGFFRLDALALTENTVIEIRILRLRRAVLLLKPDYELPVTWPVRQPDDNGTAVFRIDYQLLNISGAPTAITARIVSKHQKFKVSVTAADEDAATADSSTMLRVNHAAIARFSAWARISAEDIKATPELYAEPLRLEFVAESAPSTASFWQGQLVRPLSPGLHKQVVIPAAELAEIRRQLTENPDAIKPLLNYTRVKKAADELVTKPLLHIPTGHHRCTNNWRGNWRPGDFMPEAVDLKTGAREVGTPNASHTWQTYFANPGMVLEHLGLSYLYTGAEMYAEKAVELFRLYAEQYTDSTWNDMFQVPWNRGPAILSASRTSTSSTYGSNMFFKWHCRLLSMTADSPAWTEEVRQQIYLGFVLPYATELMKFPGGISNMTDITNHNVLLLGLVFSDPHLVHWAAYSDPGILRRLTDIDPDGFSAEGRPLNYHFAAMTEFMPSITYLANSGIPVDVPWKRLLEAVRMPFRRAALNGRVPATGDCGRGNMVAGKNRHADMLIPMFPEEDWLYDVGATPLRLFLNARKLEPEGLKKLYMTEPHIFRHAGMAILRSGETPETQITATLDYGRNLFHAALDRNQVTLMAFGRVFSHGPGSLYNIGSGGMQRNQHPRLDRFIGSGSLGHNVILVDGSNQVEAVGELLAWEPRPERQAAVSRVAGIAPGTVHTRALILSRGALVILDEMDSDSARTYDFTWHNFGKLSLGDGWTGVPAAEPIGSQANYQNIEELQRLRNGSGPVRLRWDLQEQVPFSQLEARREKGDLEPVFLELWHGADAAGEAYTGYTALNNPITGNMPEPTPSLFHRVKGGKVRFATVLVPHRGETGLTHVLLDKNANVKLEFKNGDSDFLSLDEFVRD